MGRGDSPFLDPEEEGKAMKADVWGRKREVKNTVVAVR